MNKTNGVIIALLVILIALVAYGIFKPKVTAPVQNSAVSTEFVPTNTTTISNSAGKDYQPTPTDTTKKFSPSSTIYTSSIDHFSLSIPTNMNLADPDPTESSYTTDRRYYIGYTKGTTPQLPYFRSIFVLNEPCSAGEVVNINGIQYIRADSTEGGMESAQIESFYCVVHNNKTYILRFAWGYAKYTQSVPDRNTATIKFNNELTQLNFKFI